MLWSVFPHPLRGPYTDRIWTRIVRPRSSWSVSIACNLRHLAALIIDRKNESNDDILIQSASFRR